MKSRGFRLAVIAALGLAGASAFAALGVWQVKRMAWKHDLISRVETRVKAQPVAAPGPAVAAPDSAAAGEANWGDASENEYLHVRASGQFLHDREALTQAVTDLGPGFWVMTPLKTDAGFTVLVNRGFVPADRRDQATRKQAQPTGPVTVAGLLRLTEPDGGFLRSNDPATGRWHSRDVAAIALAHNLQQNQQSVAPYFIDADSTPNPGGYPVGGLTVVRFADNHLVYAVTWFALALMVVVAAVFVARFDARRGQNDGDQNDAGKRNGEWRSARRNRT